MYMYVLQGLICIYVVFEIIQHICRIKLIRHVYVLQRYLLYNKYVDEESIRCLTIYAVSQYMFFNNTCCLTLYAA